MLYRISIHPDFIIYRKDVLIKDYSNNRLVLDIAKQLQNVIFNERKKELGKLWKY